MNAITRIGNALAGESSPGWARVQAAWLLLCGIGCGWACWWHLSEGRYERATLTGVAAPLYVAIGVLAWARAKR